MTGYQLPVRRGGGGLQKSQLDAAYRPIYRPAYAVAAGARGDYDPRRVIYNAKAKNLFNLRSAIAAAKAGVGHARLGFIGDSTTSGVTATSGTGVRGTGDIPFLLQQRLAALGLTQAAGSGYITAGGRQPDSRVTLSGFTLNVPYAKSAASGNTVTFTIPAAQAGTTVRLHYVGNSAAFTWTVNGVAQTAPSVAHGSTLQILEATGLTAGVAQTVVVTASAANVFILGCVSGAASAGAGGIAFYNYAVSGSGTHDATAGAFAWDAVAQNFSYIWPLLQMPSALDGTSGQASKASPLHAVFINLIINDWNTNVAIATHLSRHQTIINALQALSTAPDIVLVVPPAVDNGAADNTNDGAHPWSSYVGNYYTLADSYDLPLIDLGDLWAVPGNTDVQNWTRANTAGLMTTANPFHPSATGYAEQSAAHLDLLLAA